MPFHVTAPDPSTLATQLGSLTAGPGVVSAIRTASTESGTRFDALLASAAMESGLNPAAKASTSSASGLFQFTEQTWLNAVRQNGAAHGLGAEAAAVVRRGDRLTVEDPGLRQKILDLRLDPQASSGLAGDHLHGIADKLTTAIGRAPDAAEVYLGHFLGSGGATQMLRAVQSAPNRPAADVLPEAAQANRAMFYGPDGSPYTTTQFMDRLRGRVERAYASVGSTMPAGPLGFAGPTPPGRKADAPEAGTTGWGSSTPRRSAAPPERLMLATLSAVFTRLDREGHAAKPAGRRTHGLPAGLMAAMQTAG